MATRLNSGREQLDLLQSSSSEGEEVVEITRESGDDDDGEHPLPRDHSLKRSSGRVRRPSKRLKGYDIY
jgi:hypothetical protein